jgi:hypothetical protein
MKLTFGFGNAKVSNAIATFSLPAGFTCPYAKECLSKASKLSGKIVDGQHCKFRCWAASQECTFPSVRKSRWNNFNLLKNQKSNIQSTADLIQRSLPYGIAMIRIHVSGDYYSESYFLSWLNVALNNPMTVFYGYTKATPLVVKYLKHIPPNFRLIASKGGTHDHLIKEYRLKYAEVVFTTEEARRKGLEIDHDDSHAFMGTQSFALLLHGQQPAGTLASQALQLLRAQGMGGYNKETKYLAPEKQVKLFVLPPMVGRRKKSKYPLTFTKKSV